MRRGTFRLIAAVMFAVAAAVRVNNVLVFSPLRAYDGFSHFSYIWFMAENWRVPLATAGWEFFQPPLYYAFMAWVWSALAPIDPILRLRIGTLAIALLGLIPAVASYAIARRYLPGRRVVHLLAMGLMLFVPVHLYSAGFLGNENLTAFLCAMSLPAALATLRNPTGRRAAALGVWLGLAMLAKFTAIVVVIGALGTLAARAVVRRRRATAAAATQQMMTTAAHATGTPAADMRAAAIAALVMLAICGWYYARNVRMYGTPFKMSREIFMLQRYEHVQAKGRRGILEYVLFDPMILRRPQWPRGVPLTGERPVGSEYSAARESVLTGMYANTWFEGYGGWVLPLVTEDEGVRRSGQLLLTLALFPSLLMLVGFGRALWRVWQRGWDDTLVFMLITFAAMLLVLVQGTHAVPIHAAVKATYLMPVSLIFGFWLALGADWLARVRAKWFRIAVVACGLLAACSSAIFLQGRLVARWWFDDWLRNMYWHNLYGVVYYAAGDTKKAEDLFRLAADEHFHLAYENLAALAFDQDRPLEALYGVRTAARLQPSQSYGTPADRALFNRLTRAEYLNTMAVIYARLGWLQTAISAAHEAVADDPMLPEASYDLAALKLASAFADGNSHAGAVRTAVIAQSRNLLGNAIMRDPAFFEARALAGTVEALSGNCDSATTLIEDALRPHPHEHRFYPVTTGVGDMQAAAVRRRRHITTLPDVLQPGFQLRRCRETGFGA